MASSKVEYDGSSLINGILYFYRIIKHTSKLSVIMIYQKFYKYGIHIMNIIVEKQGLTDRHIDYYLGLEEVSDAINNNQTVLRITDE